MTILANYCKHSGQRLKITSKTLKSKHNYHTEKNRMQKCFTTEDFS